MAKTIKGSSGGQECIRVPTWVCKDRFNLGRERLGTLGELINRGQSAFVAEIVFFIQREQNLDEIKSGASQASDRIEHVAAFRKVGSMDEREFG